MKCQAIVIAEATNNNNYGICVVINCSSYATKILKVSAGPNGETILLSVCDSCVSKFSQQEINITTNATIVQQQRQQTMELKY